MSRRSSSFGGIGHAYREIIDLLAQRGQELAFEPMDYCALYGMERGSGTIGGLIAVNASGPRRIRAGAARDHLLGFRAVSGRAEAFKSGGRVMKNVTGYDLSKLVTGSHGTLAILTEVTVKVLPKAETEETLLILGLGDDEAIKVLTEASGLPHEVSSFAHAPAAAAPAMNGGFGGQSVTALRLEGPPVSISKRKQDLISHFKAQCKEFGSLNAANSNKFWTALRDALPLAALDRDIWRISTAPAEGARVVGLIKTGGVPLKSWFYDWAGGLVGSRPPRLRTAMRRLSEPPSIQPEGTQPSFALRRRREPPSRLSPPAAGAGGIIRAGQNQLRPRAHS